MSKLWQYKVQKTLGFTTSCSHYSTLKAFSSCSAFTIIIWPSLTRNLPPSPFAPKERAKERKKKSVMEKEVQGGGTNLHFLWMFHDHLSRRTPGTFRSGLVWKIVFATLSWVLQSMPPFQFFFRQTRWRGLFFFLSSLKTWFLHTRISLDPAGGGRAEKKMKRRGREGRRGECQSGMSLISPWKGKRERA